MTTSPKKALDKLSRLRSPFPPPPRRQTRSLASRRKQAVSISSSIRSSTHPPAGSSHHNPYRRHRRLSAPGSPTIARLAASSATSSVSNANSNSNSSSSPSNRRRNRTSMANVPQLQLTGEGDEHDDLTTAILVLARGLAFVKKLVHEMLLTMADNVKRDRQVNDSVPPPPWHTIDTSIETTKAMKRATDPRGTIKALVFLQPDIAKARFHHFQSENTILFLWSALLL